MCTELEGRANIWYADLDRLRRRAVDLACSDASHVVEVAALEVIRVQLEDAAVAAREAATLDLLRELEQEEADKKVAGWRFEGWAAACWGHFDCCGLRVCVRVRGRISLCKFTANWA